MANTIEIALAFARARRRSRWTRAELDAFHARHAPADGTGVETADQFEAAFSHRNALGLTLAEARAEAAHELSGGAPRFPGYSFGFSTGTLRPAGVFVTSEKERARWVGAILGKFLPLRMLSGTDVALVLKHNNRLYTDVRKTRRLRLHYFNAASPADSWADEMCKLEPDVLIGPPSALEHLARSEPFLRRPFQPELLLAGAEPMFPQDKTFLARAFRVEPRAIYQAKEGFLGAGCSFGRLHLNEDLIYFESLGLGRGRFVPVITDFTRTSQRYQRFRLDDVLLASPAPCPCGQPFAALTAVEGRANDVLLLPDSRRVFPLEVNDALLPHLTTGRDRIADYVVTQSHPGQITLAVEAEATGAALPALQQLLTPAAVLPAEYSAPNPGEKRRRVRRLFDPHNGWLNRLTVSRNRFSGS